MKKLILLAGVLTAGLALYAQTISDFFGQDFYESLNQGQYEAAGEVLTRWEKAEPESAELLAGKIKLFALTGRTDSAKYYAGLFAQRQDVEEGYKQYLADIVDRLSTPPDTVRYKFYQMVLLAQLAEIHPSDEMKHFLMNPQQAVALFRNQGIVVERDLSTTSAQRVVADSTEMIVWTMPEPENLIDCKYVAFVPADSCFEYFTFEKTIPFGEQPENMYILCQSKYKYNEPSSHIHSNYRVGAGDDCTPKQFAKMVEWARATSQNKGH